MDLTGKYLIPGLIDAHVHLGIGGRPGANALADLRAGFTTVVDLGALSHAILRLRDSINAGLRPGPRVLAAGLWVGIKGGVCEFTGIGIAGGAEQFRARIRENAAAGADVVKLCVSGWPADAFANPGGSELSDEVLAASVAEAHAEGKLAIAHAISRGSVQASLRAGVDGLAHAAYLDSATAAAMRDKRMFMIATLASLTGSDTSAASRGLRESVALAHRLGVRILLGTDGGVLPHGRNAEEALALRDAGLPPLEVLRAGTRYAAEAFRLADSLGAVRRGMVADLVALDGDPLKDLAVLRKPRLVMVRGSIVSP
jgi:imidazolonepropionase-like amidohydrolase